MDDGSPLARPNRFTDSLTTANILQFVTTNITREILFLNGWQFFFFPQITVLLKIVLSKWFKLNKYFILFYDIYKCC